MQQISTLERHIHIAMGNPTKTERDDFHQFADWCAFHGLAMPASGEDVGEYLIELLGHGYSLEQIERAANSILAYYDRREYFISRVDVGKALAIIEATFPNRVLN